MSDQDRPQPPADPDATRRVDPAADPGATQRVGPDVTRRVDPGATWQADDADASRTRRIDPVQAGGLAGGTAAWEGTADPYGGPAAAPSEDAGPVEDEPVEEPDRRKRDLAFGIGGLLLGFLIAVVVIALGTSDRGADGEVAAADERIEALEAEVDERDARIDALEAQVAELEAAAGASDADAEAERQALNERSQALDERVERIDERSQALDRREAELEERERQLDEREQQTDQPADAEPGGDTGDGGEGILPELDTDQVETFIDRLLDRIRDLF
jgi:hypothetical protein